MKIYILNAFDLGGGGEIVEVELVFSCCSCRKVHLKRGNFHLYSKFFFHQFQVNPGRTSFSFLFLLPLSPSSFSFLFFLSLFVAKILKHALGENDSWSTQDRRKSAKLCCPALIKSSCNTITHAHWTVSQSKPLAFNLIPSPIFH